MAEIAKIFSTPIYVNRVTGDEFLQVQNELAQCVNHVKYDQAYEGWGKTTDVTPLQGDIVAERNLIHFKEMIDKNVEEFSVGVAFKPRPVINRTSWLTKSNKNCYTPVHNHSFYDVSGCYYHKTNRKDGSIFFMNPALAATSSYFLQFMPAYIKMEPEEGLLLLFPSYLMHGVQTNETDEDRISLAFSLTFER